MVIVYYSEQGQRRCWAIIDAEDESCRYLLNRFAMSPVN